MGGIYLTGMQGLGDTIYERAILKLCDAARIDTWIHTSWPQLFVDLPRIKCLAGITSLRTQKKNLLANRNMIVRHRPVGIPNHHWHYCGHHGMSILAALEKSFPVKFDEPLSLDLPEQYLPNTDYQPYIVVRPCTLRREWRADSRNCLPEYVEQAVNQLRKKYKIVLLADLQDGKEWSIGNLPYADYQFIKGELDITKIISLIRGAAGMVSPVGWAVPMALATGTKLFCIMGGQGKHNQPSRLLDDRIDCSMIRFAMPDNFCLCGDPKHACSKTISGFDDQLTSWMESL